MRLSYTTLITVFLLNLTIVYAQSTRYNQGAGMDESIMFIILMVFLLVVFWSFHISVFQLQQYGVHGQDLCLPLDEP